MKFLVLFALVAGAFASVEKCPANSHFEECGTACPTTCKNYENPPKVCVLLCVPGCFCDEGYVETEDGRCVKPERCSIEDVWESDSDRCSQPAETGLCRGYFPRYHFDKKAGQCKKFVYGGCGGNENNFKTVEECASACGNQADAVCGENERFNGCGTACPLTCENYDNPPKFCVLMCKIGCECEKGFVRRADGKCVKPEQCPNRQALHAKTRNACEEDKEVGPCKAAFARFYFNKKTGQCEPFIYGGCDGNSNNFLTQDDCEDVCIY